MDSSLVIVLVQSINALIVLQLKCWIGYSKHYMHHVSKIHNSKCQIIKQKLRSGCTIHT